LYEEERSHGGSEKGGEKPVIAIFGVIGDLSFLMYEGEVRACAWWCALERTAYKN
jgi:hypothetical protein